MRKIILRTIECKNGMYLYPCQVDYRNCCISLLKKKDSASDAVQANIFNIISFEFMQLKNPTAETPINFSKSGKHVHIDNFSSHYTGDNTK